MGQQNHLIEKLSFTIRSASRDEGKRVENEVLAQKKEELLESLSGVLDEVASGGETIRFDKLEIDLGVVKNNELVETFSEAFSRVIQDNGAASSLKKRSRSTEDFPRYVDPEDRPGEIFFFYLKHGKFPWWAASNDILPEAKSLRKRYRHHRSDFRKNLLEAIHGNRFAARRLIYRYASTDLAAILNLIEPDITIRKYETLFRFMRKAAQHIQPAAVPTPEQQFSGLLLTEMARTFNTHASLSTESLITRTVYTFFKKHNMPEKVIHGTSFRKLTSGRSNSVAPSPASARWLRRMIYPSLNRYPDPPARSHGDDTEYPGVAGQVTKRQSGRRKKEIDATGKQETGIHDQNDHPDHPAEALAPEKSQVQPSDTEKTFYYINNAGLVLLHAFLPACFETLEYLTPEKQFKNPGSVASAVMLTQYMVSGKHEYHEQAFALNKVLCGTAPDVPVWNAELKRTERREADKLLKSVLKHWDKLGNTTVEGLRTTFLRREGKLIWNDGLFHLYMASGPYDVLLNYIPWPWSMIKLPWMKNMLTVSGQK